jgi:hypothetical protein
MLRTSLAPPRTIETLPRSFSVPGTDPTNPRKETRPARTSGSIREGIYSVSKQGTEVARIARAAKIELNMIKYSAARECHDQAARASPASCFAGLFVVG